MINILGQPRERRYYLMQNKLSILCTLLLPLLITACQGVGGTKSDRQQVEPACCQAEEAALLTSFFQSWPVDGGELLLQAEIEPLPDSPGKVQVTIFFFDKTPLVIFIVLEKEDDDYQKWVERQGYILSIDNRGQNGANFLLQTPEDTVSLGDNQKVLRFDLTQ